jgi:hypothetical protein
VEKNLVPMHHRGGIMLPTPENIDRAAAEAEAERAHDAEVQRAQPVNLARRWSISTDMAQFPATYGGYHY